MDFVLQSCQTCFYPRAFACALSPFHTFPFLSFNLVSLKDAFCYLWVHVYLTIALLLSSCGSNHAENTLFFYVVYTPGLLS
jgi:hypothetical protein